VLEALIVPPTRDLGDGFTVKRALPAAAKRAVGPFVFFDQMGPAVLAAGGGLDVRPHPHIGLATLTYLFEGEILHRDSLGTVQPIRPGEVNWMIAGRGIVHSERTPPELRRPGSRLFGLQLWIALPKAHEETDPAFTHHGSASLPVIRQKGTRIRLVAGTLYGERSPVRTFSEMFYADVELEPGAELQLPAEHAERAVYVVHGDLQISGEGRGFKSEELLVLKPEGPAILKAGATPTRLMLLGGAPLDGPRHVWWNFVSSSRARIDQAADEWQAGRFDRVPGDDQFIPLPERKRAGGVDYP
jgi:redox-sensitive bicupin YhaK (pirin superfamily)